MAVRLVVRHPKSAAGEAGEICFEFEQARVVIGRSPGADVRLPGAAVSDTHATIEQQGSHYALRDEGSTNGTRVNGVALVTSRPRLLADGDELAVAEFSIRFAEGPLRRGATSPERTASLARRMIRELLDERDGPSKDPFLRVSEGPERGTLLELGQPPARFVIGRQADASFVLSEADVSSAHIELLRDLDGTLARDLGQSGIEINGKRTRERRLRHGDVLRAGATALTYQDLAEQALRALEQQPDLTFTKTAPIMIAREPPAIVIAPEVPSDHEAAEAAPEIDSTRPATPVDLVVYALAVLVFVLSVAGLFWLFK